MRSRWKSHDWGEKKGVYQSINISDAQNSTFSYCYEPQSMWRQREHSRSILFALYFLVWLKNVNTTMFLPIKEKDHIIEKIRGVAPCSYAYIVRFKSKSIVIGNKLIHDKVDTYICTTFFNLWLQVNVCFSQLRKVSSVYQLPLKILAYNWLSWFFTNPFQILLSSSQNKWVNFHHHHHHPPPP